MKKLITLLLLAGLCVGLLVYNIAFPTPNSGETEPATEPTAPTQPPVGQVRIMNNDPDRQAAWEMLAEEYTSRTDVPVMVLTGTEETQPTLFTVSGEEDLVQVQAQCLDLSDTEAYAQLASWDLTLTVDGKVCGIASEIEAFGLVCNASLLAQAGSTHTDIECFDDLKSVVEFITANSEDLGFSAFAKVDPTRNFPLRLASLTGDSRAFFDLFINNATCPPSEMASVSEDDAMNDFLTGKAVFYLARTGEHDKLSALGTEYLSILPVYLGGENEERQSLCAVGSSYWCVRNDAPEQDIQATLEFLDYLVQPRADGSVPIDDLQLLSPYRQATMASNVLEIALRSDLAAGKELLICKNVSQIPEGIAEALIAYAAEPTDENWAAVAAILEQ